MDFKLVSDFKPTGDQPNAIKEIVAQFQNQDPFVTLQWVTGSGKTFTMANAVQELQRPTLVLAHNKTLAARADRMLTLVDGQWSWIKQNWNPF